MKRKVLRFLSLCLTLALILTLSGITAFAEQAETTVSETESVSAVGDSETIMQKISSKLKVRTQNNILEGAMPCRGEAHALVVYITLKDLEPLSDWNAETFQNLFFDTSEPETEYGYEKVFHSLALYYQKSSYGKLSISGTVDCYTTQKASTEYNSLDEICKEALDAALEDKNLADYDANGDGYLDAVYFLFSNSNFTLVPGNYVTGFYYEKEGYQTAEAVFIGCGYCTNASVIAHETAHLMGLPDIYAGVGVNPGGTCADSLMDAESSDLPGIMKYFYGWIDNLVEIADENVSQAQLKSYSTNPELMVIYPEGNTQSKYVFIVEYLTMEQCNAGLSYLGDSGGLRIWRVLLNVDENYEIAGNSEIKAPGNSPYNYLEAIHPYGECSYILRSGDSFTPYTVPSSFYSTALEVTGDAVYSSDRLYSGICLSEIKFENQSADFQVEIASQVQDITPEFQCTSLAGSLGSIGENNVQEIVRISADTELYIANHEGCYVQTETETFPVDLKADYDGKYIRVQVSEETGEKLNAEEKFRLIIPANTIKNSYGCVNEEINMEILASRIVSLKLYGKAAEYTNPYNTSTLSVPKAIRENDTTLLAVIRNTEDGLYSSSHIFRLIKYDMNTNQLTEIELENQLDGQITLCNDISDVGLYQITESTFLVLTQFENGCYFDLYQNDGTHLADNIIYDEICTERIVYNISADEFEIGISGILYTIDFSDGISYQKEQMAGSIAGVIKILPLNDGKKLVAAYRGAELWDGDTIVSLEMTEEEVNFLTGGVVYKEEDSYLVFGYEGQDLIVKQFDMDFTLLGTKTVLEGIPMNTLYRFPLSVQKLNDEYTVYFEAVPAEAAISYANSYVYTFDLNGNLKSYYRYGDTTSGYHAGYYRMSENDYVMVGSSFFQHLVMNMEGEDPDTGEDPDAGENPDTGKAPDASDNPDGGDHSGDNGGNLNDNSNSGTGGNAESGSSSENKITLPGVGQIIIDTKTGTQYKVTKAGEKNGTVAYLKPATSKKTTVSIPASISVDGITYKVTSVAAKAFKSNKKVKKITIGSNVKTIGKEAFSQCKSLQTVRLGKNVTSIGEKAFYKCQKITGIVIPSKVSKIGKQAFDGCKKLKYLTIKTKKLTKKSVGKNAFRGTHSKIKVKVPKGKEKLYKTILKSAGI